MVKKTRHFGLDSGIFMSPKIWVASGHVSGFSDPLMEHKKHLTVFELTIF